MMNAQGGDDERAYFSTIGNSSSPRIQLKFDPQKTITDLKNSIKNMENIINKSIEIARYRISSKSLQKLVCSARNPSQGIELQNNIQIKQNKDKKSQVTQKLKAIVAACHTTKKQPRFGNTKEVKQIFHKTELKYATHTPKNEAVKRNLFSPKLYSDNYNEQSISNSYKLVHAHSKRRWNKDSHGNLGKQEFQVTPRLQNAQNSFEKSANLSDVNLIKNVSHPLESISQTKKTSLQILINLAKMNCSHAASRQAEPKKGKKKIHLFQAKNRSKQLVTKSPTLQIDLSSFSPQRQNGDKILISEDQQSDKDLYFQQRIRTESLQPKNDKFDPSETYTLMNSSLDKSIKSKSKSKTKKVYLFLNQSEFPSVKTRGQSTPEHLIDKRKQNDIHFDNFLQKIKRYGFVQRYLSMSQIREAYERMKVAKLPQSKWPLQIVDEVYRKMKKSRQ